MAKKIFFLLYCFVMLSFCYGTAKTKPKEDKQLTWVSDHQQPYTIYLTFDDGPLNGSGVINNAVLEEQIKTNIFVVGIHVKKNNRSKRLYNSYLKNPYIQIGNHSFSHAHNHYKAFYDNPQKVLMDFLKCQQELSIPFKLARLPGRNQWRLTDTSINDVKSGAASADLLFKEGFKVFGWDIEWQHDAKTGVPIQTVQDIIEKIEMLLIEGKTVRQNHLVLLLHDQMFRKGWRESELKQLISQLKENHNYTFEHLSNYPASGRQKL